VRKAALRLASRQGRLQNGRPYMLPAAISEPLCTTEQQEWWNSVHKVTTNSARFEKTTVDFAFVEDHSFSQVAEL